MRRSARLAALVTAFALMGIAEAQAAVLAPARSLSPVTIAAAGDIASCDSAGDEATASLIRRLDPDAVLTLGDDAYPAGSADDFARCYAPTWGVFKRRTYPAPGNHDYATPSAAGYFGYFGSRAPGPYYSFDLRVWHFVSLNSEIDSAADSPQERWLRRDLRADGHRCELLYWHRPRWSGGEHGSDPGMQALWRAAYDLGVDIVLVGHDHNYQRFYRLDALGRRDPRRGVLQIVAGTGGKSHYELGTIPNRAAANGTAHGVLELTLRRGGYDLRFVPVAGSTWIDSLRGRACH